MRRYPTRRVCVDIGHKCNIDCLHCYHKHETNRDERPFKIKEDICTEIENGKYRGCEYVDFTGGEPTLCSYLPEIIKYAFDKFDMKSCVITNALCGENTLDKFIDAGTDDFLISMHGMEKTFDAFTQRPGARQQQMKFIEHLEGRGKTFRVNYCITSYTQADIVAFAEFIRERKVRIVNFINFNPHYGWMAVKDETRAMIADLPKVEVYLNRAIELLEEKNIGVNVRYYPMCRIAEGYRRCVCNDLHVTFDPYEWDYDITPKTPEKHLEWALCATNKYEMKKYECACCSHQWVCGGINKAFYQVIDDGCIQPIKKTGDIDVYDSHFYRRQNILTLEGR